MHPWKVFQQKNQSQWFSVWVKVVHYRVTRLHYRMRTGRYMIGFIEGGAIKKMIKKVTLVLFGALLLSLVIAGVAQAAHTPQNIYDDFLANGKLTVQYTNAELQAYLNDAQLHEYGDKTVIDRLDKTVLDLVSRSTFPFTGFQLAMAGLVVVVLIGGGIALRRFSRPRKPSGPSQPS